MARVKVVNWVTLDGVMQGPGEPDEDTRDSFAAGGWATAYSDETVGRALGEVMAGDFAWLFGRTGYEGMLRSWNDKGGPFKDGLNDRTKYVASHNPQITLQWPNSELLSGDVPAAVARLKLDTDLVIMGSGVLINALITADLIDEYLLMIAPVVLGGGRRLFRDGAHTALTLKSAIPAGSGALVTHYEVIR